MTIDYDDDDEEQYAPPARTRRGSLPRVESPIVPRDSIGGTALVAVVAIMAFLASLTAGAVMLVRASAGEWQSEIAREVTIQIRPQPGRDIEADVVKATVIATAFPGIGEVRPYSKEETARLLEPWLGKGLSLDDLPVPRIVVVKLTPGQDADLAALEKELVAQVPGASLDDHRGWIERMRAMAGTAVIGGIVVLCLMLIATVLSVTFATRAAMATNRPVIEVLHLIGAKDSFIAAQFQRHFLILGLKGGLIGGGVAIVLFAFAGALTSWFSGTAEADQVTSLFGTFSIGIAGYIILLLQIALIAGVTAATSRHTVNQTLEAV